MSSLPPQHPLCHRCPPRSKNYVPQLFSYWIIQISTRIHLFRHWGFSSTTNHDLLKKSECCFQKRRAVLYLEWNLCLLNFWWVIFLVSIIFSLLQNNCSFKLFITEFNKWNRWRHLLHRVSLGMIIILRGVLWWTLGCVFLKKNKLHGEAVQV